MGVCVFRVLRLSSPQHGWQDENSLKELGNLQKQGIETGEAWVEKLSEAVPHCKACVAIFTPAFFESEFCGKEIQIFLERLADWRGKLENAGKAPGAIIPVIWIPRVQAVDSGELPAK
jgi:hypothetical protein